MTNAFCLLPQAYHGRSLTEYIAAFRESPYIVRTTDDGTEFFLPRRAECMQCETVFRFDDTLEDLSVDDEDFNEGEPLLSVQFSKDPQDYVQVDYGCGAVMCGRCFAGDDDDFDAIGLHNGENTQTSFDTMQKPKHDFNDRLFCKMCGADAIGLQAKGKDAMICPGTAR